MTPRRSTWLVVAAAATAGAGLVHAAAAGSHNDDASLAWLFAVTALLQLGWAAIVVVRPWAWLVMAGIALNAACLLTWVLSRTVGLFGPLAGVEDLGTADAAAALVAAVACAAAVGTLIVRSSAPPRLDRPVLVVSLVAIVALVVPAMVAPHTHSHDDGGHEHDEVAAAATAPSPPHTDTDTGTDAHAHDGAVAVDDSAPIVSLSDARLTEEQRSRAISLLVSTRAAMLARFPDRASVEAAGYQWIGDGRRVGGYEHFVNQEYMTDGRELDADHIESIVLQRQADGSETVVTAMYILERGSTMADAPPIAGSLTTWHDHQNLCWDGNGRLAGIYVGGQCRPGGTFRPTAPMMHVWLTDPPCGPFAGVEGHGSEDCAHSHGAA
jgi:hypothetical protein